MREVLSLNFLFLEPFFGGSHRNFVEGIISNSRHRIEVISLPARFWKWRMRGAALHFFKRIRKIEEYDGIMASDLMSLSDLKTLIGPSCPPVLVYFHENQLSYPVPPGESMDFQFGFTDITTALAADRVLFNSHFHFNTFFDRLPDFLNMMPDYRPRWVVEAIMKKSGVLYPGCQFDSGHSEFFEDSVPPLIIWNHRWEFDKRPEDFFEVLDSVVEKGMDFRLALLGEDFQSVSGSFLSAKERFSKRIIQYGYVKSQEEYLEWLKKGSIVVSTAIQENFGISIVEAARFGCLPLVPDRLSYPEIFPEEFHQYVLYENLEDLTERLLYVLSDLSAFRSARKKISRSMTRFAWENVINSYDTELEALAGL